MNVMMRLRGTDPLFTLENVLTKYEEQKAYWINFAITTEYDNPISFQYFVEDIEEYFLITDDITDDIEQSKEDFEPEVLTHVDNMCSLRNKIITDVISYHEKNMRVLQESAAVWKAQCKSLDKVRGH